ncbi:MAG: ABC transporter permease [Candidatus Sericytochromatia bacterium]
MFRYIIKRLIQMIPLLFIISFLGFGIIRVAEIFANADPLTQMKMSPTVTEETIRREKQRLGYEKPFAEKVKLSATPLTPSEVDPEKVMDDSVAVKPAGSETSMTRLNPGEGEYFAAPGILLLSGADLGNKLDIAYQNKAGQASKSSVEVDGAIALPMDVNPDSVTVSYTETKAPLTALKLEPGSYVFGLGRYFFSAADAGKEATLEYSIPNGFLVRYSKWMVQFLKGDMGESYYFKSPVSTLIVSRLNNTIILGVATLIVTWLIAIPLGIFLAVRQYSLIDQVSSAISYFFMGFPDFFLAILLLLLAASTGWFPIGEMSSIKGAEAGFPMNVIDVLHHLILPTICLSLISIASLQRRMRANLLDVIAEDYIKTARAKGLPERKVIYKHAVRNAINPIITLLGFEVAGLISGAAFVEIIFSWPGLGNMMLQAVLGTDLNLVMAGLMISTVMLLLGNLLADILLAFADPRIKLEA